MAKVRRGGDHTGSPEGREGGVKRSNRAHTHHSGRVRAAGTVAAGEPHAGSSRCARPEGGHASGSDGPRLPWGRAGLGLFRCQRAAAAQLEGTAVQDFIANMTSIREYQGETACGRRGSFRAPQHGEQGRSGSARGLGGLEKRSPNGTRSALGPMVGAYPSKVARSAARGPAAVGRAPPTMYERKHICTRQRSNNRPLAT